MAYTKEKMKQYHAERRQRLRREGMCISCGRRFAEKGRARCVECLEKEKQCRAERRQRLRREGMCVACGHRFAEKGRAWCAECLEKDRLGRKRRKMMASPRLREALGNGKA